MTETDTTFVVFIDALSPNDLSRSDWLSENMSGHLEASIPRVTPVVMSSVYTGMDPAENGIMRNQAFGGEEPTRPEQSTFMERAAQDGKSVLNLYMPYCGPESGVIGISTAAGGQSFISAPDNFCDGNVRVPGPTGDLVGDERHDVVFDHNVDYITQIFSTARSLAPNFDIVCIGIRLVDSYCHFQYNCNEDGRDASLGQRYRDKLTEIIDIQLQQTEPRGDVLFFSDHGATEKTETFFINKWLQDKGYLSYEMDLDFMEDVESRGMFGGDTHPVEDRIPNLIGVNHPLLEIDMDETQAICGDAYDSSVTVFDDSITDELVSELSEEDAFRDVYTKDDLYNSDGAYYDGTPDVIPDRAEGVFVSGNIHPDPIGMAWHRTGVHDMIGVYGGTDVPSEGKVSPVELNGIIESYLDIEKGHSPIDIDTLTAEDKEALLGELQ